ncbi:MAG: hypothetical protein Q8L15_15160 [Methylobacter sp.]|nr:hypothetical protein [Methylobacter sp.]
MKPWICRQLGGLFFLVSCSLYGQASPVLIVYPQAEEPLHRIYASIIQGIEHKVSNTELLELPEGTHDAQSELDRHHPNKIIALGKRVADTIGLSSYRGQTLVGMVHSNPSDTVGVSLALDSQDFAKRLVHLAPSIKRVFAVQEHTHPAITSSPVGSVLTPAIIIREGGDMTATIRLLGHLVEEEATTLDAVLIPANLPSNIFYEIAKIAWDRKIILLSTNLAHLESGVLMAFYPDPEGLGEQLGTLANSGKFEFENLNAVTAGLNQRVAQHLNVEIEASKLKLFSVKLK